VYLLVFIKNKWSIAPLICHIDNALYPIAWYNTDEGIGFDTNDISIFTNNFSLIGV